MITSFASAILALAAGEEVGEENEDKGEGKNDKEMKEDRLESVEREGFEGGNLAVSRDIPVGRKSMSNSNNGVRKQGYWNKSAAKEAATEADDVSDAVDGVTTLQEISNEEGESGGAEGKDTRAKNKPETMKREHNGTDDNEANQDVNQPKA